jgi:cytoplasmic iron level regulating protein YaaA (DUF328/UPF0246 family)
MLIFLSPAKSLDYRTPAQVATHTLPAFLKQSESLIKQLRKLSPADIANLMDLSDPLALLNFNRLRRLESAVHPGKRQTGDAGVRRRCL